VSSSRDLILARIARAHGSTPADRTTIDPDAYARAVTREYLTVHADRTPEETTDLLAHHLADYRAIVHRTTPTALPALIARLLADRGARTVLVPDQLPATWLESTSTTQVRDRPDTSHHELDTIDSVITGCALAIAETGTIVLDAGPAQGRRRITLVPDHHICVIHAPQQVVDSVPQALPRLDPTRPQTWISGPSATSDIELDRVEGVHGPRTLEVVLVTG